MNWFKKVLKVFNKPLPGMKEYEVSSGDLNVTIFAYNSDEAVKKAIAQYDPKFLGEIIQCNVVGAIETYTLTTRVLAEMGMKVMKDV